MWYPDEVPVQTAIIAREDPVPGIDPLPAAEPSSPPSAERGDAPSNDDRSSVDVVVRGGLWGMFGQVAPLVVNLALTPYVLHGLGVDRYGLFLFVATVSTFIGSFDGGITQSAQRFFAIYAGRDDKKETTRLLCTLTSLVVLTGIVLSAVLWFVAGPIAHGLHMRAGLRPEAIFMLRTVGVLVALSLLRNLPVGVLQAYRRFALTNSTYTFSYAIYVVGLILTVHEGWGLRGVALTLTAQQVFVTLILVPQTLHYLVFAGARLYSWTELKVFLSYAGKVQIVGLAALFLQEMDALLLGAILPIRNVALYNIGASFASQLRAIPLNAGGPLLSVLGTRFGRDGREGLEDEFRGLQRLWVLAISGWLSVGLGATYFAITAWLGSGFESSGVVGCVALAGNIFYLGPIVMNVMLGVAGRPGFEAKFSVVMVVTNVALTIPLLLTGPIGVAAATGVSQVISALYLVRIVRRDYAKELISFLQQIPYLACVVTVAAVVGMELAVRPWMPSGPVGLLGSGVPAGLGLIVYGCLTLGPSKTWAMALNLLGKVRDRLRPAPMERTS